jgi:hypothetical protein
LASTVSFRGFGTKGGSKVGASKERRIRANEHSLREAVNEIALHQLETEVDNVASLAVIGTRRRIVNLDGLMSLSPSRRIGVQP